MHVYLIQHYRNNGLSCTVKTAGYYDSEEMAKREMEKLDKVFRFNPQYEYFYIEKHILNSVVKEYE